MTPSGRTLAAERTQLARLRTVLALLLVSALVVRLATREHPVTAFACAAVAVVGLGLALRLRRGPMSVGHAALLTGACAVLALVAAANVNP